MHAQPLYGFASKDPARFLRAAGHGDPFYIQDPELSIAQARQPPRGSQLRRLCCVGPRPSSGTQV